MSKRPVERRLSADVKSGVVSGGVFHVQHQHVVESIGAESAGQVAVRRDVRRRAAAVALAPLGAGCVDATDDRRQREEDVPVAAARHPVVVRHALQVETAAALRHGVVRTEPTLRPRYADTTFVVKQPATPEAFRDTLHRHI